MGGEIAEIDSNLTDLAELFSWLDFVIELPGNMTTFRLRVFSHAYAFEKSNKDKHLVDVFEIEWNIGLNTFHVLFRVFYVWINRDLIRFWSK